MASGFTSPSWGRGCENSCPQAILFSGMFGTLYQLPVFRVYEDCLFNLSALLVPSESWWVFVHFLNLSVGLWSCFPVAHSFFIEDGLGDLPPEPRRLQLLLIGIRFPLPKWNNHRMCTILTKERNAKSVWVPRCGISKIYYFEFSRTFSLNSFVRYLDCIFCLENCHSIWVFQSTYWSLFLCLFVRCRLTAWFTHVGICRCASTALKKLGEWTVSVQFVERRSRML